MGRRSYHLPSWDQVLLDVGVTGDQTLGRRAINLLQPEARGRINGLFVGLFFLGGAAGAAMVGIAWESGGWPIDLCPRRWLWHRSVGDRDYSCRRTRAERETLIGLLKKFGYMAAAASGQSKEEEKFC